MPEETEEQKQLRLRYECVQLHSGGPLPGLPGDHAPGSYVIDWQERKIYPDAEWRALFLPANSVPIAASEAPAQSAPDNDAQNEPSQADESIPTEVTPITVGGDAPDPGGDEHKTDPAIPIVAPSDPATFQILADVPGEPLASLPEQSIEQLPTGQAFLVDSTPIEAGVSDASLPDAQGTIIDVHDDPDATVQVLPTPESEMPPVEQSPSTRIDETEQASSTVTEASEPTDDASQEAQP